jgi:hypothetical protein
MIPLIACPQAFSKPDLRNQPVEPTLSVSAWYLAKVTV